MKLNLPTAEILIEATENVSSEFLNKLNWGWLSIPTLSIAFFFHSGNCRQTLIQIHQTRCRLYLMLFFDISTVPNNPNACKSLVNVSLKSFVTASSDKVKMVGCLRRKEKISVTKDMS